MTAVDRFLAALVEHPETAVMGAMLRPYRQMASSPAELEKTLDLLASMWQEAKSAGD